MLHIRYLMKFSTCLFVFLLVFTFQLGWLSFDLHCQSPHNIESTQFDLLESDDDYLHSKGIVTNKFSENQTYVQGIAFDFIDFDSSYLARANEHDLGHFFKENAKNCSNEILIWRRSSQDLIQNELLWKVCPALLIDTIFPENPVNPYKFSVYAGIGKIIPHRAYFRPEVTQYSFPISFEFVKINMRQKIWQNMHPNIDLGGYIGYLFFGNHSLFGQAFAMTPTLNWIKRKKNIEYQFSLGAGVGYISKIFSYYDNYENNVISAHINNCTHIKNQINIYNRSSVSYSIGLHIIHFSNGRSSQPNLGINLFTLNAGLSWSGKFSKSNSELPARPIYVETAINMDTKPWFAISNQFIGGIGVTSYADSGAKHPVYYIGYSLGYSHKMRNQFRTSIVGEQHNELTRFLITQDVHNQNSKYWDKKVLHYIGYESYFGLIGLELHVGYYLYNYFRADESLPMILGLRCNVFNRTKAYRINPVAGLRLKTHGFRAEYLSVYLGIEIGSVKKK